MPIFTRRFYLVSPATVLSPDQVRNEVITSRDLFPRTMTAERAIEFFATHRVLPNTSFCTACNFPRTVYNDKASVQDTMLWTCCKCKSRCSIRQDSFLSHWRFFAGDFLIFMYFWCQGVTQTFCATEARVSGHTAVAWCKTLRGVCDAANLEPDKRPTLGEMLSFLQATHEEPEHAEVIRRREIPLGAVPLGAIEQYQPIKAVEECVETSIQGDADSTENAEVVESVEPEHSSENPKTMENMEVVKDIEAQPVNATQNTNMDDAEVLEATEKKLAEATKCKDNTQEAEGMEAIEDKSVDCSEPLDLSAYTSQRRPHSSTSLHLEAASMSENRPDNQPTTQLNLLSSRPRKRKIDTETSPQVVPIMNGVSLQIPQALLNPAINLGPGQTLVGIEVRPQVVFKVVERKPSNPTNAP